MMFNTTNTYEEVHAQLKGSIIAGDKFGDMVAEGDVVKVGRRKELYRIHKIIQVDNGNDGEPYPVFELAPLEPQTIFRGEHQIELWEKDA
jgi:DNA/RNA endonuclease YhcR with UshA esterase domain